jgi:hypothetical protein
VLAASIIRAMSDSETSANFYQTFRRNNPEDNQPSSFVHDYKPLGSIKCGKSLDQLSDNHLLNDTDQWSELVHGVTTRDLAIMVPFLYKSLVMQPQGFNIATFPIHYSWNIQSFEATV